MRANPARYGDFAFYPCMPYAHKYANAVTEDGHARRGRAGSCPTRARRRRAARRHARSAKKDIEGITTLLIDAEMKMFEG